MIYFLWLVTSVLPCRQGHAGHNYGSNAQQRGIHGIEAHTGKNREKISGFIFIFPQKNHFFLKMGELLAHFEILFCFFEKNTTFSHDFSQCIPLL